MPRRLAVSASRRHRQRGTTILIALIMLLALAVAAVAVVRSSDSSVLVAGNVAVKMDAVNQAELGVVAAINMARANLVAAGASNNNNTTRNYLAAPLADNFPAGNPDGIPDVLTDQPGTPFNSATFRATYTANPLVGANNVVINYLVERMCDPTLVGAPPVRESCHMVLDLRNQSGSSNLEGGIAAFEEPVVFRVTVRVDQPNQLAPTLVQEYFTVF